MRVVNVRDVRSDRFRRMLAVAAGAIAATYLTLVLLATVCMTAHGVGHAEPHDSSHHPVHSLLCVWACQAGAPDCLSAASSLSPTMFLALAGAMLPAAILRQPTFPQASSRAPPQ